MIDALSGLRGQRGFTLVGLMLSQALGLLKLHFTKIYILFIEIILKLNNHL